MALCLGFPFAIWHRPLSALSTNWCINAMLWVTQWERGRESELERPKERERGGERERDAGWIWMRQTQGGNEALGEASTEWERMEGQGKSFQLHKWLRAAWQNDEWRGKKRNHPVMACFFFQLAFSVSLSILLSPSPLSTQLSTLPGATGSIWKCKLQARWSCCFFFFWKMWKVSSSWGWGE